MTRVGFEPTPADADEKPRFRGKLFAWVTHLRPLGHLAVQQLSWHFYLNHATSMSIQWKTRTRINMSLFCCQVLVWCSHLCQVRWVKLVWLSTKRIKTPLAIICASQDEIYRCKSSERNRGYRDLWHLICVLSMARPPTDCPLSGQFSSARSVVLVLCSSPTKTLKKSMHSAESRSPTWQMVLLMDEYIGIQVRHLFILVKLLLIDRENVIVI